MHIEQKGYATNISSFLLFWGKLRKVDELSRLCEFLGVESNMEF